MPPRMRQSGRCPRAEPTSQGTGVPSVSRIVGRVRSPVPENAPWDLGILSRHARCRGLEPSRHPGCSGGGGGPRLSPDEANEVVAELYYLAGEATPLVQETTGLHQYLPSEVKVVDRAEWIRSNLDSFRRISAPLTERLETASAFTREVGSRATGAQLGLVLGFVGSRVLGQFEIFTEDDPRLLLVAPNIVEIERQLQVKPRDFRLWVCVHEQTHRIQFAAAPWLTGYLLENIHEYMGLSDMSTGELFGRLAGAVRAVRSGDEPDGGDRGTAIAGTEAGVRPVDGGDEPAGGTRRRRDGRGRAAGDSHGESDPGSVPVPAGRGHQRLGGFPAQGPGDGPQSASICPGCLLRASRDGRRRHAPAQRRLGVRRSSAHPRGRSRIPRSGLPGSDAGGPWCPAHVR